MTELPIVTVYTKPDCRQCDATKRWLNQHGIAFDPINLEADIEPHGKGSNLAAVKALGYMSAPVVVASLDGIPGNEIHWSGFNPIELARLQKKAAA